MYTEHDLKKAYEAGVASVEANRQLDDLLEKGIKQAPVKQTFETYLSNLNCDEEIKRVD